MRTTSCFLLLPIVLTFTIASCDKKIPENQKVNQLYVTDKGDSVETGYWVIESGRNGVNTRGNFKDGFREGVWSYQTETDSVSVEWTTFNKDNVKLNLPSSIKFTDQELPVIFLGTLRDDARHCYYTLLRYNLKQVNASVYDYIYQYIQSLEQSLVENLERREVKKFVFTTTEIFRVKVDLIRERKYQAISYIFTHNDVLYDLTYREEHNRIGNIELEVFNDVLYSFQTNDFDLFDVNNKTYTSEEVVDVTL